MNSMLTALIFDWFNALSSSPEWNGSNIPKTVDPACTLFDSSVVSEEGVIIRLPFARHSSLDIAFNPRSIKT